MSAALVRQRPGHIGGAMSLGQHVGAQPSDARYQPSLAGFSFTIPAE